jgi:hypothetical protein
MVVSKKKKSNEQFLNVYTPFEGIVPFRTCTIGDMVFSGAPVLYDHVEDAAHWDENPGLCCPCFIGSLSLASLVLFSALLSSPLM